MFMGEDGNTKHQTPNTNKPSKSKRDNAPWDRVMVSKIAAASYLDYCRRFASRG
jgi:hypothetical protein